MQLVAGDRAGELLADAGRLEKLLQFAQRELEVAERASFYQQLLNHPAVVAALWKQRGPDGVRGLVTAEPDPAGRGRILAALLNSARLRPQSGELQLPALAIQLARQAPTAAARGEFLKSLADAAGIRLVLADAEARQALWQFIRADEGQAWRSDVVLPLLQAGPSERLLRDKDDMAWLLRFAHEETAERRRMQLVQHILADPRGLPLLVAPENFDLAVKLAQSLHPNTRGPLLARLATAPAAVEHLVRTKQLDRLVSLATDETDANARSQYLSGLFQSQPAMTALLDADRFDALLSLVRAAGDPLQRAKLLGEFLGTEAAVQRIVARQQTRVLVDVFRDEDIRRRGGSTCSGC